MKAGERQYIGRFAPSPTGPLHAGSVVAALASWLDARAHQGQWRLRIEDVDTARCVPGAQDSIVGTLEALGLHWDGPILLQSTRFDAYNDALQTLSKQGLAYPCACTRKELEGHGMVYPGTCRQGLPPGKTARAWRLRIPEGTLHIPDRWQGLYREDTARLCGDVVLLRADGFWAYQLAVVVDDAWQGVSDVVRGADLLDSTGRQIHLQTALKLNCVRYMHVPVVKNPHGDKLSKQTLANAVDTQQPLTALTAAALHLGLQAGDLKDCANPEEFLSKATQLWSARFGSARGAFAPQTTQ
jgi:glutamyl-Q tRNA(Asp) synthetase